MEHITWGWHPMYCILMTPFPFSVLPPFSWTEQKQGFNYYNDNFQDGKGKPVITNPLNYVIIEDVFVSPY
jgi:hypothetical protein